eukprot:3785952-Amphidinium_carterae.1
MAPGAITSGFSSFGRPTARFCEPIAIQSSPSMRATTRSISSSRLSDPDTLGPPGAEPLAEAAPGQVGPAQGILEEVYRCLHPSSWPWPGGLLFSSAPGNNAVSS